MPVLAEGLETQCCHVFKLARRYALPWTPMADGMKRASIKWIISTLHLLIHYKLVYHNNCAWLTKFTSVIHVHQWQSWKKNIPEVMVQKCWLPLPRCTVDLRIAQGNRALSQVSTSSSICTVLRQTALEDCHRPEELFQAAGAVSRDLHTSLALTKARYDDIVQDYTGILHPQRAIPLGERPRTHLMLLARQPVLVQMTWWKMYGVDTAVEGDEFEGENVSRGALIWILASTACASTCLIINRPSRPTATHYHNRYCLMAIVPAHWKVLLARH